MKSGIYQITNKVNGDFYIGSSVNLHSRKLSHFSTLRKNESSCKGLQAAVNSFGIENFSFSPIAKCPTEYLIKLEQWFIDTAKPKYNVLKFAHSSHGCQMPQYAKDAISLSMSTPVSQYTLQGEFIKKWIGIRVAARALGFQLRKCNETNLSVGGFVWVLDGQELPDFELIRERKKNKSQSKAVQQINKQGEIVAEFYGVREACRATRIDHRSISQVAAGSKTRKSAGGFIWKYKD